MNTPNNSRNLTATQDSPARLEKVIEYYQTHKNFSQAIGENRTEIIAILNRGGAFWGKQVTSAELPGGTLFLPTALIISFFLQKIAKKSPHNQNDHGGVRIEGSE